MVSIINLEQCRAHVDRLMHIGTVLLPLLLDGSTHVPDVGWLN